MKGNFRVINSQVSLDAAIKDLEQQFQAFKWLMMQTTNEKQRSQLQNSSLHLWCEMLANEANKRGFDVKHFINEISKRAEIPWSGGTVKELIWRPVQLAYMGEQSTTKASTKDYPAIYDIINKATGEAMGFHVPWPSKDHLGAAA